MVYQLNQQQSDDSPTSEYTLKNGKKTVISKDGHLWLDESKGFGGKTGWYDSNNKLVEGYDPYPVDAQNLNRAVTPSDNLMTFNTKYKLKNGKTTLQSKDGHLWLDESKGLVVSLDGMIPIINQQRIMIHTEGTRQVNHP